MSSHHTSLPSTLTTSDDPPSFRAIQDPVTIPNVARDAGAASTVPKTTDNTSGAPPSLVQGYKQVESFGPSEDYITDEDIDEETVYVTLDLGNIEPTLVPSSTSYRLVGLETPTPYLQLSGTIFKGTHNELLGSELLFTDDTTQGGSSLPVYTDSSLYHRIQTGQNGH
ncbi:hypothetical protein BDN72DRAFT_774548 [Pluteus cervinus]|uniref:Uncharacterized protein n=1 Tax=Pluteus cervinus TaxID=181527 RepID=A0ACD3AFQ6_9AGAR|nr:hypothetical protein BDN72DRAFT_774548 [Pluteus cervinus]